jgi:hypothetical protein
MVPSSLGLSSPNKNEMLVLLHAEGEGTTIPRITMNQPFNITAPHSR